MHQTVQRITTAAKYLYSQLSDPESLTYFPEVPRKSRIRIGSGYLWWLLRHGEINHFYYLYGFDRKEGVRHGDYFANREFYTLRDRTNRLGETGFRDSNYAVLLKDKFVFGQYLQALGYPTQRIIALSDRESIVWMDSKQIAVFSDLLQSGRDLDGFLKGLQGECGEDVYHLKIEKGKVFLQRREVTLDELKQSIKGRYIIQERLQQHSKMAQLHPDSVNTIRLITIRNAETYVAFSAGVRMGTNRNTRDNWATGGLFASVDLTTGKLLEECFYKPGFGKRVKQHPNTGIVFKDFKVPFFHEAVKMATSLHSFFYGVFSIGWDIAITEQGPAFIEGNDNWEISLHQAHEGGLKKAFCSYLP